MDLISQPTIASNYRYRTYRYHYTLQTILYHNVIPIIAIITYFLSIEVIMKLVKFLQKLNREQVTIELKNGTVLQGTVVGVDATMNCHLKKVKVTVRGKAPKSVQVLSVRGSTMRAWLLPESLNLDALLVDDGPKERAVVPSSNQSQQARGRGRGRGRGGSGGGKR